MLPAPPLERSLPNPFWLEHLEGDLALVLEVVSQVDRSHPALTDLTLNGVAAL